MRRASAALVVVAFVFVAAPSRADEAWQPPTNTARESEFPARDSGESWRRPDGRVTRGFEPPAQRYGPGHRGVKFATGAGAPVTAVAGGVVTFAGPVATRLYVAVRHDRHRTTTYSYLATVSVRLGDRVGAGQALGTSDGVFHLGLRIDGDYADPMSLFAPTEVRLVALP